MTLAELSTDLGHPRRTARQSGQGPPRLRSSICSSSPRPCQPGAVPGRCRLASGSHVAGSAGDPLRHSGDAGKRPSLRVTRRNTRNNIRVLLRAGRGARASCRRLSPGPAPPAPGAPPSFSWSTMTSAPYQTTYRSQVGPPLLRRTPGHSGPPISRLAWQTYVAEV